eukprot:SAG11_NODE_5006_length_1693_cov_1.245922_2_plen_211_part_00
MKEAFKVCRVPALVVQDGTRLALGCLDKRARVFALDDAEPPGEWVGFGAGVAAVAWSAAGRWLAALGGDTLLVVEREPQRADSPLICVGAAVAQRGGGRDGGGGTFSSVGWCTAREELLVAAGGADVLQVFNVLQTDGGWPRRATPVARVSMGDGPGCRAASTLLGFGLLGGVDDEECERDDRSGGGSSVVFARGDWLACARLPHRVPRW